jgi:hypothetical protein
MLPSISIIKNIFKEGPNATQLLIHSNTPSEKSLKQKILEKLSEKSSDKKSKSEYLSQNKNKEEEVKNRSYSFSKTMHSPSSASIYSEEEYNNFKNNNSEHYSTQYGNTYLKEKEISYSSLYCKNICSYISKIVRKSPDILTNEENDQCIDIMNSFWGDSSDNVIPKYYLTNVKEGEIFSIDFFFTIKDSILNLRRLTSYQHEYMKNRASDEEKYEIICLYDKVCNDYYETMLKTRPTTPA